MRHSFYVCWLLLIASNVFATPHTLVGYGSSDAVLPAKNQELFLMGFELGFQKKIKGRGFGDSVVIDQINDGSPLGAVESIKKLMKSEPAMIVGFPTSQEALLAANLTKERGVLMISAAAGHDDMGRLGTTVYTLGESMTTTVIATKKFIARMFPEKRGLLVTNPYAVFSKNQEDAFLKAAPDDKHLSTKITAIHLQKDLTLDEQHVRELKQHEYDFIVLTSYASEAAKLLEQFDKNKIDLPMVVNSSWTMGDVDFGRRFLTSRKAETYVASDWAQTSQFPPLIEKLVKNKYGRPVTAEIAAGYDLGIISAKILNAIKGPVTKESVLKEFSLQRCFDELATGRVCFESKGGHAIRELAFLRFTSKGLVPIETSPRR